MSRPLWRAVAFTVLPLRERLAGTRSHVVPVGIEGRGDLEPVPVGVVEVDAVDDLVVDGTEHIDAVLDEPVAPAVDLLRRHFLRRVDLHGEVAEDVVGRM